MRNLVTCSQMKEIDRRTMEEIGIPSMVLMERAAFAVVEEISGYLRKGDRIWAACGTGNNGADGIACARMLHLRGYDVTVLLAGDVSRGTKEYRQQLKIAENLGLDCIEFHDFLPGACDVVIDAVFGVGLCREVEGGYRELLELLAGQNARLTAAVDIPSGIHGDTGAVMGIALKADLTVTFGFEKLGTAFYPGKEYAGRVTVADIGFPKAEACGVRPAAFSYGPEDLSGIPRRQAYSHKGTFGRVLIAAGSEDMSGAAYLSALAAYRTGAGLVKIFTVEENKEALKQLLPEAIFSTYTREEAREMGAEFAARIKEECAWASVIVLGPGLSKEAYTERLVEEILSDAYVPIVVDADGLNVIADHPRLTGYYTENIIVTPHLGEMAGLTGKTVEELQSGLLAAAREYADQYGITCVLKDAVTVAALKDGKTYVNGSGNSAMAKAGSGDVLTGIIAGLLALGLEEDKAAAMGVYLHGRAGDFVRNELGEHSLLARDLAAHIKDAMRAGEAPGGGDYEKIQ